jgi:chorismate synthase
MPLLFRLAFKPTATVRKRQVTANESGEPITLRAGGRHDPCVVPRAVPIVESAIHLVLMDMMLRQRAKHPEWWLRYSKNAKKYLSEMSEL